MNQATEGSLGEALVHVAAVPCWRLPAPGSGETEAVAHVTTWIDGRLESSSVLVSSQAASEFVR